MPTTYTHYRFGCECLKTVPAKLRKKILAQKDLYFIGVHGPDIFFYYNPLKKNPVNDFGGSLHDVPARAFFEHCATVYHEQETEKDAMLSYMLGFLSHFALDSTCHGYIDRKKEVSGISHNKIEAEYDAHYMSLDHRMPQMVDRGRSLKPTIFTARIISRFFDFDEKTILRTTKMQRLTMKVLNSPMGLKKKLLRKLIEVLNIPGDFGDLFIDNETLPGCVDSNLRLDKLRPVALYRYEILCKNYLAYLEGKEELSSYFDHNFEPWPDYQEIPVLSAENEKKFVVEKVI